MYNSIRYQFIALHIKSLGGIAYFAYEKQKQQPHLCSTAFVQTVIVVQYPASVQWDQSTQRGL
jgi:hypothetical protein